MNTDIFATNLLNIKHYYLGINYWPYVLSRIWFFDSFVEETSSDKRDCSVISFPCL